MSSIPQTKMAKITSELQKAYKALFINLPNKPVKLFSLGNAKLPNDCAIFNLLAVYDCPNCKTCADTCYAMFRQGTASVFKSREVNSQIARRSLPIFILAATVQLQWLKQTKNIKYVRIHEAGDFFSVGYYMAWREIAKAHPNLEFFAMTKNDEVYELHKILSKLPCNNLNVMTSMIDGKRNYGSEEYCDKLVLENGAYKCPDTSHNGVCLQQCKYCLKGDRPCFIIHGTLKGKDKYEERIA